MRQSIREFVEICARTLPIKGPVYEFGSYQVPGQEELADLRDLFGGFEFVGTDMREGPGVDRVLDLHNIDLPDGVIGTAISMDTLEHVEYPRKAVENLHRVTQTGGIVILSSQMRFRIHNYPSDYWRFTPEGFRSLLKPFEGKFVGHAGREKFPHSVVGIGFKGPAPSLDAFLGEFEAWQGRWDSEDGRIKRPIPVRICRNLGKSAVKRWNRIFGRTE